MRTGSSFRAINQKHLEVMPVSEVFEWPKDIVRIPSNHDPEPSERDDLESLLYCIAFFKNNTLPWV